MLKFKFKHKNNIKLAIRNHKIQFLHWWDDVMSNKHSQKLTQRKKNLNNSKITRARNVRVAYLESALKTAPNNANYTRIYFWPFLTKMARLTPYRFYEFGQNFSVVCFKRTVWNLEKYFYKTRFQSFAGKDELETQGKLITF